MGLRENFGEIWPSVQAPDTPDWVAQQISANNAPKLEGQCLNSDNHALYIGKIVPLSPAEKAARLLLGEDSKFASNETYSSEFIQAALAILFEHLNPGQKARFAVGYKLSEYCNGTASVQDAISYDDEVALIKRLAEEHFQGDENNFEVVDMLAYHPELRSALERADRDPKTGRVELDSVFPEDSASDSSNSFDAYDIAKQLYIGTKEDPQFLAQIKSLPTDKLKALRTAPEDELDPIDAYGLFEIAIRLDDAINGCVFQGGIDRQAKYDNVIKQLLVGNEKFYKKSASLLALIKLLKNVPFRAFHIDRKENYYQRRVVQQRARARFGLLTAAGLAGAVGAGVATDKITKHIEELGRTETTEKAEAYFETHWPHRECMMYDSWDRRPYSMLAGEMLDEIKNELAFRYGMDEETSWTIALQISEKMVGANPGKSQPSICAFTKSKRLLVEFIDRYVYEHHLAVSLSGETLNAPYEPFHEHRALFEKTAQQECKGLDFNVQSWPIIGFPSAEFVGTYSDAYAFGSEMLYSDVYLYNDWSGPVVMATVPSYKEVHVRMPDKRLSYDTFVKNGAYLSAERGCEVAKHFVRDAKTYELSVLPDKRQDLMFDIFRPGTVSHAAHFDGVDAWPKDGAKVVEESEITRFSMDGDWQLGYYRVGDFNENEILVAKRPGEDVFSLEAARELACWRATNLAAGAWDRTRSWILDSYFDLDLESVKTCPGQANSLGRFE